jgi:nucleoside-diphosphate-sugar epimerase
MTSGSRLIIGCGYLGIRLARLWSQEPTPLFATTRQASRADAFREQGLLPVRWDVLEGGDPLPKVDTVVYAVGYDRSQSSSKRAVYVDGLRNTLAHLPRPGRFIYVSSTGVYGDHQGNWIDESTPPAPLDEGGAACLEAEKMLQDFAAQNDWQINILRFAGIYGPGRVIGVEGLRKGQPIAGNPDGWLNLIHVEDGARVIDAASRRAGDGATYLISDGQPVLRGDFYTYLARQAGTPAPVFDPTAASRHRGDRRISNQKMMRELAPLLAYPSYREGVDHSLLANPQS